MDKRSRLFLLVSFLGSYACFFSVLLLSGGQAGDAAGFPGLLLVALGLLMPFFGAALALGKGENGLGAAWKERPDNSWLHSLLFLALHYGLLLVMGFAKLRTPSEYTPAILLAAPLLGLSNIGWQRLLHPLLLKGRGFWKATAANGLIRALWALPLFFLPGSFLKPELFLSFAVWCLGHTLLLATIDRLSRSILCGSLYTVLFVLFFAVLRHESETSFFVAGALDAVLAFLYNSRLMKENAPAGK